MMTFEYDRYIKTCSSCGCRFMSQADESIDRDAALDFIKYHKTCGKCTTRTNDRHGMFVKDGPSIIYTRHSSVKPMPAVTIREPDPIIYRWEEPLEFEDIPGTRGLIRQK